METICQCLSFAEVNEISWVGKGLGLIGIVSSFLAGFGAGGLDILRVQSEVAGIIVSAVVASIVISPIVVPTIVSYSTI